MELKPKSHDKIIALMAKGAAIPNPMTLDIGDEVNIEQISGDGVVIYPGCRIYGEKTVISPGVVLGRESPVTIDNCQLGGKVALKGGYFAKSTFLDRANMGLGAQVREGCLLEEEANGAHCVGLKQTILFPFVTLGSLINFCDCLMAGGTSRKDHSEVGSSYIHFNFTPDGDKATASLIGDVPRGVMLNQPRIFLGGQGGIVGPARIGYGNVVAAGSILRGDYPEDNQLIVGKTPGPLKRHFALQLYPQLKRIVDSNISYLSNLSALEQWYIHVRQRFLATQPFGHLIFEGALEKLNLAKQERIKRLKLLADKAAGETDGPRHDLKAKVDEVVATFEKEDAQKVMPYDRDRFLEMLTTTRSHKDGDYIHTIQSLPDEAVQLGTKWLQTIVNELCSTAGSHLPTL